jgi:GAF domain-containing protein
MKSTVEARSAKAESYERAAAAIAELVRGLDDPVAAMASCAAVLHESVERASWTGFYRVVAPELLRIGPYQGPVGCLEIPFERGVCGAAARRRETVVVEDVHAFEGHIACDAAARSEIVVPVLDRTGRLRAVLDIDSHWPAAFDAVDARGLEAVVRLLAPCFPPD